MVSCTAPPNAWTWTPSGSPEGCPRRFEKGPWTARPSSCVTREVSDQAICAGEQRCQGFEPQTLSLKAETPARRSTMATKFSSMSLPNRVNPSAQGEKVAGLPDTAASQRSFLLLEGLTDLPCEELSGYENQVTCEQAKTSSIPETVN
eukprot:scaffold1667_cov258-Pinguiococcus_pyrenoidosus.AAC.26